MKVRPLNEIEVEYDREPDQCPICHRSIHPTRIDDAAVLIGRLRQAIPAKLRVVFRCPSQECQELFIGYYEEGYDSRYRGGDGEFVLRAGAPYHPKSPEVFEGITKLSPRFAKIYGQALSAEHYGLEEVAGCGLRKALEFLIKDYCISEHPEDEKAIKQMFLGNCIAKYVDDRRIKSVAERAAWLSNDEVHYERKWVDQDLQDLKRVLQLTVSWVEMHLRTKALEKSMPGRS
jgi:hypothetical protein